MNPAQPPPRAPQQPADSSRPGSITARAAQQLSVRAEQRAHQITDDVLRHVLSQPRRSMPVRAHGADSAIHVSELVITTVLTQAIQHHLSGVAVSRLVVVADREQHLQEVVLELIGRYGLDLIGAAADARRLVANSLLGLLGPLDTEVRVTVTHVRIADITLGDPQLVDQQDE